MTLKYIVIYVVATIVLTVLIGKLLKRRREEIEFEEELRRIGRDELRAEAMKGSREVKPK